jgi:hypothetical protein
MMLDWNRSAFVGFWAMSAGVLLVLVGTLAVAIGPSRDPRIAISLVPAT